MADWKKTFRIHVCCSVLVLAFLVSVPLLAATAAVEAKDEAAAEPALQKDPLGRLPSSPEEARERLANREIGWPDYGCEGGFEAAAMTAGVQRGVRVAIPYNSVEGSVDTAGADVKLELWRGGAKLGEKAVKAGADGWFKADLSDIGGGIRSGDVVKVTDLGAGPTVDIDCTLTANIDFANNRVTGNTLAGYAVDAYIIAPSTYYADLPPGAARRIGVSPAAGGAYTAEITDLDLRRGDAAFVFATNPATGHRVMNAAAGSGAGLVVYPQYNDVMGFYVPGTQLLVRADSAHRNVDTMQDGFFVAMFYDFNISAGTRVSCDMGGTREVIVRDVTARCDPGDNKVHLTTPANRDVRLTMDPYIDPVIYQIPRWQNPTGNIVVELGERFTATGTEVFNVTWYDDDGDAVVYEFQTFSWYLAEGYTGGEFDTWVLVQNPGSKDAAVSVTFQLPPGQWAPPLTFIVGPETRASIHLNELPGLGATDVSTKVTSTTGAWIMAERAVYFDYYGKQGGHNSIGTITPSRTWYLAEGYTGGDFDTWVLAQNPGTQDAVVTLDFQLPPEQFAVPFVFELPAGTRKSILLNEVPGLEETDVATKVTATEPVVAERAMYFTYDGKSGGHDSIGIPEILP